MQVVWNQRNWGENPDPDYPWGATLYGDKGTLKFSVWSYDFIPKGDGPKVHRKALEEREQYPEDVQHKATELFAAPGTRRTHAELPRRAPERPAAGGRHRTGLHFLGVLHHGEPVHGTGSQFPVGCDAGRVVGDEEANRRLARTYRGDWKHPTPESV